jgi:hypothetical protein
MVTMPGLPMFGHGQIEGFEEKYGMEYRRAYRDETPDEWLIERHEREIFPLMKKRLLFSGSEHFCLFDLYKQDGSIDENVFAYSNRADGERSLVFYNNSYYGTSGWIHNSAANIPQKDGGVRKDNLFQMLGLDGDFVLFHEQRSGLWFIRSVQEVRERGFFAVLNGYEAQVFLDIHSVRDADGRWSKICNELNGRGIEDLGAAMHDIFLAELYAPFAALFDPAYIDAFEQAVADCAISGKIKAGDGFIITIKDGVLAFITMALKYVGGADGKFEIFTSASYYPRESEMPAPEAVWEDFEAYVRRIFQYALMRVKTARKPVEGVASDVFMAENIGKNVGTGASERMRPALPLGYGLFSLLRSILGKGACASGEDAAALIRHWQLDRKLRNAYAKAGIPSDIAYNATELMKAVITRTAPAESLYTADTLPASIIAENYQKEDFRQLLGVNVFDDVTWFNKERFDFALMYASLFMAFENENAFTVQPAGQTKGKTKSDGKIAASKDGKKTAAQTAESAWIARLTFIMDVREKLRRAEEKSAYRLDKLIEALE